MVQKNSASEKKENSEEVLTELEQDEICEKSASINVLYASPEIMHRDYVPKVRTRDYPYIHAENSKICPYCGNADAQQEGTCSVCGKELSPQVDFDATLQECPFCGAMVLMTMFCPRCGSSIREWEARMNTVYASPVPVLPEKKIEEKKESFFLRLFKRKR